MLKSDLKSTITGPQFGGGRRMKIDLGTSLQSGMNVFVDMNS